jgi:hypothetical protein
VRARVPVKESSVIRLTRCDLLQVVAAAAVDSLILILLAIDQNHSPRFDLASLLSGQMFALMASWRANSSRQIDLGQ